MSDIEALSAKYEAALAAEHAAPGDAKKRTAAAAAGQKLADAREADRAGRELTIVADTKEG